MKKVVLVTGASSGIGKASVFSLLKDGHIVYGAARREDHMKDIKEAGAHVVIMDVTKPDQVNSCVDRIISEQGRIDVLVNNAGFGVMGAIEDVLLENARSQFEVNLFGLANMTTTVLPHMRKAGRGRIINVASMGGKIYTPLSGWYIASKHALEGWSDCLRFELKQHNIEVSIIEPGIIRTNFFNDFDSQMLAQAKGGAYEESTRKMISLVQNANEQRFTSTGDTVGKTIARAVRARRSRTRYVTGYMAHLGLLGRRVFSDRFYDRMVGFAMNRYSK